jgi:hypothetical protein
VSALVIESRQAVPRHGDPRSSSPLPERDYAALEYIGRWYQVAQYQLEDAVFSQRSPTVASRCVRRMVAAGYIAVERWNRIGVNLIRLTSRGRSALVVRGVATSTLFVPEKPVALKDLAHHLWIVDAGLMLSRLDSALELTPCWALRRRLAALRPAAIPDVLAIRVGEDGAPEGVLAVEVDLGGERLKNVLVPKLGVLQETLAGWCSGQPTAIVVLTVGARRIAALTAAVQVLPQTIPVLVYSLPRQSARPGLAELRRTLGDALAS